MHYRNKIVSIIETMKSKVSLLPLFDSLAFNNQIESLYPYYEAAFVHESGVLRRDLIKLSLHSQYIIEEYEENRYQVLDDSIFKKKFEMKKDG